MRKDEKLFREGKRASLLGRVLTAITALVLAVTMGLGATVAQAATSAVSDPATVRDYETLLGATTANIGRIWTDKSVFTGDASDGTITVKKAEGADFLTSLSAISSTSNLLSMSNTPLDIVLVLDASGSMDDSFGSSTRIAALQSAANDFIDRIAAKNASVSEADLQHQVSIVKFAGTKTTKVGNDKYSSGTSKYNYSQVMKTMTACTQDNKSEFTDLINAIDPAGATNAQAGMELAQTLASGRSNAKKVVIFFTDGTPTTQSEFNPSVASGAIAAAKTMKEAGASVYSISILDNADPTASPTASSTTNENKFMHAVSSNYVSATYTGSGTDASRYTWSFGARAKDSDGNDATYYKSAANASQLDEIFKDIEQEIVDGAGYPTKATDGAGDTSGYITVDDELGAYMEVTDLSTLVYNGKVYGSPTKSTSGNVDTYTFEGEVTAGASVSNLNKLVITVTRSDDAATGDKVQLKIPAALIPLHHYNIDTSDPKNVSMTVDATTPVVVCYSSAVKSAAKELLANPDDAMKAYMQANTDSSGNVKFYANKWTGTNADKGDAVATFEPSDGNLYYFYTSDTALYTDSSFNTPATSIDENATYYYKHSYYKMDKWNVDETGAATGTAYEVTEAITLPGSTAKTYQDAGNIGTDTTGGLFVKDGTPRLNFINTLHKAKDTNTTATASDVLNPEWASAATLASYETINSYLGNNGIVTNSGDLTVKLVNDGGSADDEFTVKVTLTDAKGNPISGTFGEGDDAVTFDDKGETTFTLKDAETKSIPGVPAGATYTVTQTSPDRYATTYKVNDGTATGTPATGNVNADTPQNVVITNVPGKTANVSHDGQTVSADGQLVGVGDELTYTINWVNSASQAAKVTVTDTLPAGVKFKSATEGGTENSGNVTWSLGEKDAGATGSVSVTVEVIGTDNSYGTAATSVTISNTAKIGLKNDSGVDTSYDTNPSTAYVPTKSLVMGIGGNGRTSVGRELTYKLVTKVPAGTTNVSVTDVLPRGLEFVEADRGGEYDESTRTVTWDIPFTKATTEVTYMSIILKAKVTVDALTTDNQSIENEASFSINNGATVKTNKVVVDVNGPAEYNTDKTDTSAGVGLAKKLSGRAWKTSDSFSFTLAGNDDATTAAINAGEIVLGSTEATAKASTETTDAQSFGFGTIKFYKPGTYTFKVTESVPADADKIAGVAYSTNTATFTVNVVASDDDAVSTLSATLGAASNLEFENVYSSELDYAAAGGLSLEKTLTGHAIAADQFEWTLTASDQASADLLGIDATAGKQIKSTEAVASKSDGVVSASETISLLPTSGLKLTQANAGKTYTYTLVESKGGDTTKGYTNDTEARTITIAVTDDGEGRLTATTTVKKGNAVEGTYTYTTGQSGATPAVVSLTNAYAASGTLGGDGEGAVKINASKTLSGRDLVAKEFTFNVYEVINGETGTTPVATGTNDAAGNISFTAINYTQNDVGEHTYKVVEDTTGFSAKGLTADVAEFGITVNVEDNNDGTLKLTVGYPEGSESGLAFKNTYGKDSKATLSLKGNKYLEYMIGIGWRGPAASDVEGAFTFTLTGSDGAPMPETTTATNVSYGHGTASPSNSSFTVTFGDIEYTMENVFGTTKADEPTVTDADAAKRSKTFTYTVTESNTPGVTVAGVTNDKKATRTIEVTVTDNGDGTLSAVAKADGRDVTGKSAFSFTNSYDVKPTTVDVTDSTYGISVSKQLAGRAMQAGEFKFQLATKSGKVVATGTNDADGKVTFEGIEYDYPTTEVLTLSEVVPEDTKGVTYDTSTYHVRIEVMDDQKGGLVATCELVDEENAPLEDQSVTFKNTYAAKSVTAFFYGSKNLAGGTLSAGQFSFAISAAEGTPMPEKTTVTNDTTGRIDFGNITFDEAGTYTYTITEVNDGQDRVTYDTAARTVTIEVTDDGEGELHATFSGLEGLVFNNTLSEASDTPAGDDTKKIVPETGDVLSTTGIAGLAALACAAFAIGGAARRKNH